MGNQSGAHCWFQWGTRFYLKILSLFQFLIGNGGFWYFSVLDVDIFLCPKEMEVDDETGGPWVYGKSNLTPWVGNCNKSWWLKSNCAVRVPHLQISLWTGEVVAGRVSVRDFSPYVGQIIVWELWWMHRHVSEYIRLLGTRGNTSVSWHSYKIAK